MTTEAPSALILGARGRFGLAAVRAFAGAGWRVTAQCRTGRAGPRAGEPGVGPQWVEADARDTAALQAAAGRVDVVVHAMNPAYTTAAWQAQAPGLMQAAIDAGRATGALLMFPGNVYNFGAGMPSVLREDTPQRPTTGKGAVRVALERQLARAHAAHGVRSVVVRAGDFFGCDGVSLFGEAIAKHLPRGRMGWPGTPGVATPWAYVPDLVHAFVQVAQRREAIAGAEVLHFAGQTLQQADWQDALEAIAREQGWLEPRGELKVVRTPWALLRMAGLVMPTVASLAEMRYLWATPHALDNSRLLALIGEEPRTPLRTAALQSLAGLGLLVPPARWQHA